MSQDSVIKNFTIEIDAGSEPVFKGGEVITGRLKIELRHPIIINAVKLQMKGRSVWLDDPIKKDDIEKVLFDNDFTLLERPPGKPEPGHFEWIGDYEYSLPFECPLPKGCPNSYEGPYAYTRYYIKATLIHDDNSSKPPEYFVKKAFSIVAPSEGHVVIGEEQSAKDTAVFGKCCCKGKLSAELTLPKTGYLPGEDVYGTLKIGNRHPKDILQHMEVRLVDRVHRIGAPEKASVSPWRTLLVKGLESDSPVPKKKQEIEKANLLLMRIPAVCPTTKGDFDAHLNEIHNLSPLGRLMESPSTATLKFRRQPFIRIEYAIQLSLANMLILEIPIDIGEHSTRDKTTELKAFVCGAQSVDDRDEIGKIAVNGPFMFTPVYPYKENVQSKMAEVNSFVPTVATISEETTGANGVTVVEKKETHHHEISNGAVEGDEGIERSVVTTTKTIVTHVEGNETKTMEETVVEKDGEMTRTIEETVLSEDGIQTHRIEQTTVDEAGHETTTVEESEEKVETAEIPEEIQEAKERIEELMEQAKEDVASAVEDESEEKPESSVTTTVNENGEETIVSTEVIEGDGARTVRTTTLTKHADGSESTMVQEQTSSHHTTIAEQ